MKKLTTGLKDPFKIPGESDPFSSNNMELTPGKARKIRSANGMKTLGNLKKGIR